MQFGFLIAAGLSLGLLAGGMARAQSDDTLRRMTLRQDTAGWEAIGYLDLAGKGFCTGALVASDIVLTAAHCLMDSRTGKRVDPTAVKFMAGWRDGEAIATRQGRAAVIHARYAPDSGTMIERVRHDVALLHLAEPISVAQAAPLSPEGGVSPGDSVTVISYAKGRAKAPSMQRRCRVLERRSGVMAMSCDAYFGSSGAPVLSLRGGRVRVVGVMSMIAQTAQGRLSFGMDVERPLRELLAALRSGRGVFPETTAPAAKRVNLDGGARSSGAKFLRPE
ncbi:serine protease [Maritimibacter sp. 55A14]|uniref:trypsin-like serine peptidase n=1 Tax=Maritimibacter sp. 55A14 TaxID=2174844 RepID=UPI001304CF90|nr:trypsin-like peptidase domain-containing protein [Maritimibacter sp. 55A14]